MTSEWDNLLGGHYNEVYDRAQSLYDAGYINGLRTPYNEQDDQAESRPRPGVAEFMRFVLAVVTSEQERQNE